MTAVDVEVQVGTAPDLEVELQLGDGPAVDVAVTFGPPSISVLSVLPTGPRGPAGTNGTNGTNGQGVPTGGTTGQVLAKDSNTDFDTEWVDAAAGGGAVDSVNGETGVVVISAGDVGSTATGDVAATNVQSAIAELASEKATVVALAAEAVLARNADNLTSGTVADARIASTLARDSEVTSAVAAEATLARNADNLTSGTVADARIASTIARDSEVTAAVAAEATLARNADNLTSGTVADARIASTIARDSEVTSAVGAEATARDAAIAVHSADTTAVHGITDTSALETTSGAQAKVDAHVSDATDAHDASAVSVVPFGTIAATDVQAALEEVVAESGGSGLPDPWTSDQTDGNVTAAVADPTKTILEILVGEDQEEFPFVITSDTELGSIDLLLVRQSVAKGGNDILSVDDAGEMNLHVLDTGANGFTVDESGSPSAGFGRLFQLSGSMENRNEVAAFQVTSVGGVSGETASTFFDGGIRVNYFGASVAGDVFRVLPLGAIGTSAGEPADADINPGECFRWFDPTNGAARTCWKAKTLDGTVVFGYGPMAP